MAETLVNLLVEQLGSVVYHHASEGVKLVLKAKKDVDKCRSTLKLIQNVLHDAEKKQVEDPAVRDRLDQLKDVSYKMDDVLDTWNTEIGKREAKKQESQGSHEEPITSSFVEILTIFGREVEQESLVSELLGKGKPGLVIPIVGMGGLGKTTFTQLVFKDARVEAHFDIKAWVCVSDPFDVIKIAKEILEHVGGEKSKDSSNVLQILLEEIKKHIKDKKFLLVLDDVWTEKQREWERLSLPLRMQSCSEGSRILVTTRKQEVARMMRATRDMITLGS
ncbi:putative disease resistance protein RGA3 [Rosa chinensis]|uniref:putative disease resistance protein RGA3 n=1 Tax=Rosa chinensis TaxID=74649 RepID=UPI000D088DD3|nr:putative disease resistance protein RGA3 [Rosa chinensis]